MFLSPESVAWSSSVVSPSPASLFGQSLICPCLCRFSLWWLSYRWTGAVCSLCVWTPSLSTCFAGPSVLLPMSIVHFIAEWFFIIWKCCYLSIQMPVGPWGAVMDETAVTYESLCTGLWTHPFGTNTCRCGKCWTWGETSKPFSRMAPPGACPWRVLPGVPRVCRRPCCQVPVSCRLSRSGVMASISSSWSYLRFPNDFPCAHTPLVPRLWLTVFARRLLTLCWICLILKP